MSESRHYYSSSFNSNNSSENYLGFANLPNQVHRKSVKKGFEFTLMVVGESGLGKSTLINSLFGSNLYKNRKISNIEDIIDKTTEISANTVDIEERGIKLKLTVVDTPGYGDSINSYTCFSPILNYIDEQFDKFLDYENGLNRKHITDTRIHCCFYCISPIGYGLKPIDIEFMKRLHTKVNIIPIIMKSDALTKDELSKMKKKILNDIQDNNISIYTIPDCDSDEDNSFKEQMKHIRASVPFAINSSTELHDKGKKMYGRDYKWGFVEMENTDHSDFVKIRSLLVTHMQDLREVTNEVHYENYRSQRLASKGSDTYTSISGADETDYDKDRILKEKEEELKKMQEMIQKMQKQMAQQQKVE